jgi:hypothetical protein
MRPRAVNGGSTRTNHDNRFDGSDFDKVMTMGTQADLHDDDIPAEIDFSNGVRGKFFNVEARLNLPVYLEADVQTYLADRAKARGIEVAQLVNELLKKDIELIEAAR